MTKHTNKQFITVETRNGNTLYIIIDYDKLLDEKEERYQTYFLNPVDEADLLSLLRTGRPRRLPVAAQTEKCTAGHVNMNCPLCKNDMTNCAGENYSPPSRSRHRRPMKRSRKSPAVWAASCRAADPCGWRRCAWYFKLKAESVRQRRRRPDEFDFDDDDEETDDFEDESDVPNLFDEEDDE